MDADVAAISIKGGGLAGLACGITLQLNGVQSRVFERQRYPLKKVCGEFLSPRGFRRLCELGADYYLPLPIKTVRDARFYYGPRAYFDFQLDPPAYAISRAALDSALAERYRALGGDLIEGQAWNEAEMPDVDASGRPVLSGPSRWLAYKAYLAPEYAPRELDDAGLLMLTLKGGYAGLLRIEDGRIGLSLIARAPARLEDLLKGHPLLKRLAPHFQAHAAIAAFDLSSQAGADLIGDASRVWPPVVGDGMSRALASGIRKGHELAKKPLQPETTGAFQFALSKALHSLMLFPVSRRPLGLLCRAIPALPKWVYRFSRG